MPETISVNPEILEELYDKYICYDHGSPVSGTPEPVDGFRTVASAYIDERRYHKSYYLVFERIQDGALFGCVYQIGLTENHEDIFPWSPFSCGRWDSHLHRYVDLKPVECERLTVRTETVVVTKYESAE